METAGELDESFEYDNAPWDQNWTKVEAETFGI